MISTSDLSRLPDLDDFRRLTQALAVLDAILSPEWQFRYYSFNSKWAEGEMWASMRNGSGDDWFASLTPAGTALAGCAHEAPAYRFENPQPWIYAELPEVFHKPLRDEPAADGQNVSYCIWREAEDSAWRTSRRPAGEDREDGSSWFLPILEGRPELYVEFATQYYEQPVPLDAVRAVFEHAPLVDEIVNALNPEANRIELAAELLEIGYPEAS